MEWTLRGISTALACQIIDITKYAYCAMVRPRTVIMTACTTQGLSLRESFANKKSITTKVLPSKILSGQIWKHFKPLTCSSQLSFLTTSLFRLQMASKCANSSLFALRECKSWQETNFALMQWNTNCLMYQFYRRPLNHTCQWFTGLAMRNEEHCLLLGNGTSRKALQN